jgi:hypothetical protein
MGHCGGEGAVKFRGRLALAAGALMALAQPVAGQTVNCAHENAFVWKNASLNAHGTRTVHKARYHAHDLVNCNPGILQEMLFWSTAHVRNTINSYYAEVGFREYLDTGGVHRWFTFAEFRINGISTVYIGPEVAGDSWHGSKVFYRSDTAKWYFKFDQFNDGTFFDVIPPRSVGGMTTGYSDTETARSNHTSSYDHHDNIGYSIDGVPTWVAWSSNSLDYENYTESWRHHQVGSLVDEWEWIP